MWNNYFIKFLKTFKTETLQTFKFGFLKLSINLTVKYVNVIAYDVILYLDYLYHFVPILCAIIVINRLVY